MTNSILVPDDQRPAIDRIVRLNRILDNCGIEPDKFVVGGSAVMALRGMDREVGDLDLFVATRTWFDIYHAGLLGIFEGHKMPWKMYTTEPDDPHRACDPPFLYRTVDGLEINVFHAWRTRGYADINLAEWLHSPEFVRGWRCAPLSALYNWKREARREKDLPDLRMIEEWWEAGRE
jgi:hypothetical protein